jgi:hypothetical protein
MACRDTQFLRSPNEGRGSLTNPFLQAASQARASLDAQGHIRVDCWCGGCRPYYPGLTNRPPEALMSSLDIVIQDGRRLTK